ncbi:hypothetical protein ISCGN_014119 [Ixodes scapularis]
MYGAFPFDETVSYTAASPVRARPPNNSQRMRCRFLSYQHVFLAFGIGRKGRSCVCAPVSIRIGDLTRGALFSFFFIQQSPIFSLVEVPFKARYTLIVRACHWMLGFLEVPGALEDKLFPKTCVNFKEL